MAGQGGTGVKGGGGSHGPTGTAAVKGGATATPPTGSGRAKGKVGAHRPTQSRTVAGADGPTKLAAVATDSAAITPWLVAGALVYKAPLAVDADGAPDTYHPDNTGRDFNANGDIHRKPDGTFYGKSKTSPMYGVHRDPRTGQPSVQQGGQYAGYFVSTTGWGNPEFPPSDPRHYIDSTKIPYIAIRNVFFNKYVVYGDYALVIHSRTRRFAYAIVADSKGTNLGEGSIALCDALGVPSVLRVGNRAVNSGVDANEVVYIIFGKSTMVPRGTKAGTIANDFFPRSEPNLPIQVDGRAAESLERIERKGEELFARWNTRVHLIDGIPWGANQPWVWLGLDLPEVCPPDTCCLGPPPADPWETVGPVVAYLGI